MIQKIAKTIGENGCYYLCILKLFGKEMDALKLFEPFVQAKLMDRECYVLAPDKMATTLSKEKWTITKAPADYTPEPGELVVERYEHGKYSHFVLPNWDPLGDSNTRLKGKLVSKRVFRRVR
jgi:hypothetical protein